MVSDSVDNVDDFIRHQSLDKLLSAQFLIPKIICLMRLSWFVSVAAAGAGVDAAAVMN